MIFQKTNFHFEKPPKSGGKFSFFPIQNSKNEGQKHSIFMDFFKTAYFSLWFFAMHQFEWKIITFHHLEQPTEKLHSFLYSKHPPFWHDLWVDGVQWVNGFFEKWPFLDCFNWMTTVGPIGLCWKMMKNSILWLKIDCILRSEYLTRYQTNEHDFWNQLKKLH